MLFQLYNNEKINLSLQEKKDNVFSLVSKEGKEYLSLKKGELNRLDFNYDPFLFSESENSVAQKIDELYHQFMEDNFYGVESENEDNEDNEICDPFNPKEISINTKVIPMDVLLRRLKQGSLILNPDFQRNEVWTDVRKSQLIESILLEIPLPMFYVSADEEGRWTVVDGLQRISAFRDFILGANYMKTMKSEYEGLGIKLKGLEFLKNIEGCQMKELPNNFYNRIMEAQFSLTIINPGTPDEVKRNIFKRINTGGVPLSSQEIRNALYGGRISTLLKKMSEMKSFKKATDNSIKDLRMEDKELLLRFLSFMVRDNKSYKKTQNIDTWLSDTMIIYNSYPTLDSRDIKRSIERGTINTADIKKWEEEEIISKFEMAMNRALKLFGKHAFRKSYGSLRRRPINKCLFESWGVILANMSQEDVDKLISKKKLFTSEYSKLLDDEKFIIAISRDSMRQGSVSFRYDELTRIIKHCIYD